MKKYLIILGVATLAFLGGCGLNVSISPSTAPEPVIADETSKFEYIGTTNGDCNVHRDNYTLLYKYVDKEAGKIIYISEGSYCDSGRGLAVTDIESK